MRQKTLSPILVSTHAENFSFMCQDFEEPVSETSAANVLQKKLVLKH